MEEAEALGTKMAIQVDGRFKCFGTAQQIKQTYGQGFTAVFKLDMKKLDEKVERNSDSNGEAKGLVVIINNDDDIESRNSVNVRSVAGEPLSQLTIEQVKEKINQWINNEDSSVDANFVAD